ncbi:MAG TPA: hypothetical protein PKW23_03235 [Dictyoglomaceae bacterium]|nr:hypothetical protein [Dictyoglomaceae bacterium]HOP95448.1 hypothetical protein [Dictyoglomaceae bacterium]HPP15603.1 hypothetical protein [Dictyoglomaceae bacterium]HPU42919.1 hypothetical protein [Dictyoglomaceae bacterium]
MSKKQISIIIFICTLLLGIFLFIFPKISEVQAKERVYKSKRLELENTMESLLILRDSLNKLSERKKLLFQERNLLFLEEKELPFFYKDLSTVVENLKITTFELKPGEFQEIPDLPPGFPLKLQRVPIELKLAASYQQFIDFFRDMYAQSYPISFDQIILAEDKNGDVLVLNILFDIYVLKGGE